MSIPLHFLRIESTRGTTAQNDLYKFFDMYLQSYKSFYWIFKYFYHDTLASRENKQQFLSRWYSKTVSFWFIFFWFITGLIIFSHKLLSSCICVCVNYLCFWFICSLFYQDIIFNYLFYHFEGNIFFFFCKSRALSHLPVLPQILYLGIFTFDLIYCDGPAFYIFVWFSQFTLWGVIFFYYLMLANPSLVWYELNICYYFSWFLYGFVLLVQFL